VGLLCAVPSQDYIGAKWGVAQRTKDATSAAIDQAFDQGHLLRTHVLRPTRHFVLPKDIRRLQALTGPRVMPRTPTKDHTASFDPNVMGKVARNAEALQAHIVVLNGGVIGGWRRTVGRKEIVITTDLLVRLSRTERAAPGEGREALRPLCRDAYERPVAAISGTRR